MLVPKRLSDGELRLNSFPRFLEKLTTFPESGRQVIPARLVEALADEPEGRHLVEREVGQDDDKDVDGQRLDREGLLKYGYLEYKKLQVISFIGIRYQICACFSLKRQL